jgi:diguanylate cyclase (GGDEF)-like protein
MAQSDIVEFIVGIGTPDLVTKVQGFLRASGGLFSTVDVKTGLELSMWEPVIRGATPAVCSGFVAIQSLSPEMEMFFQKVSMLSNFAVIILSDSAEVIEAAQRSGLPISAPIMGLNPAILHNTMLEALEFQNMKAQRDTLQGLYDMAENRFRDMADLFADWLWEMDTNLTLTFSSTHKRPTQGGQKGKRFTESFLPEEKVRIEDDFAELTRSPRTFHDRDYWSADTYGGRVCWSVSGLPVLDPAGKLMGFRGIARDISGVKAAADQIYYLVNHDPLTGVANRQRFQDELVRTLRMASREKREGALLLLDVDRFAYVNQTYGHLVGDKMLIHLAQVLKDNVRTGDMVARLDGDQFAVLLRDVRNDDISGRVERIQQMLASRPLMVENGSLSLNMSGGAALYPHDATTADELLANALSALEKAKIRGPRRIERYDQEADSTSKTEHHGQLEWVEMLNECLTNHDTRMVLYYQPIVPLGGPAMQSKTEHYEVLVRLIDRDGNIIPPGRFISVAEEYGLVSKIDMLVASRAIDMLRTWKEQGRQVSLSVNLSGKTFDDPNFLTTARNMLKDANLPDKSLIFEITETALLRDLQVVKTFMKEMRAVGAGFALDDCGVGYSSFSYIRQLELDFIKIDGSFVRNLHASDDDQAFVKALADVARQKNISTVAEMVEHEAAMVALQSLGIDFGQGYYFAAPAAEIPTEGWNKKFVN